MITNYFFYRFENNFLPNFLSLYFFFCCSSQGNCVTLIERLLRLWSPYSCSFCRPVTVRSENCPTKRFFGVFVSNLRKESRTCVRRVHFRTCWATAPLHNDHFGRWEWRRTWLPFLVPPYERRFRCFPCSLQGLLSSCKRQKLIKMMSW